MGIIILVVILIKEQVYDLYDLWVSETLSIVLLSLANTFSFMRHSLSLAILFCFM